MLQTWSDVSETGLANAGVSWFCRKFALVNEMEPLRWVSGCFVSIHHVEAETPILWPLMRRTDSSEKTLMLGKTEGGRRSG